MAPLLLLLALSMLVLLRRWPLSPWQLVRASLHRALCLSCALFPESLVRPGSMVLVLVLLLVLLLVLTVRSGGSEACASLMHWLPVLRHCLSAGHGSGLAPSAGGRAFHSQDSPPQHRVVRRGAALQGGTEGGGRQCIFLFIVISLHVFLLSAPRFVRFAAITKKFPLAVVHVGAGCSNCALSVALSGVSTELPFYSSYL